MSQISADNHANIILQPGEVVRVSTGGTATVLAAYGAPAGTTTVTASTQDFGPYGVPAKLRVTAVSGAANCAQRSGDLGGVELVDGLRVTSPLGLRRARRQFDDAQFKVAAINLIGDSIQEVWGGDNVAVNYPSTSSASAPTAAIIDGNSIAAQVRRLFAARYAGVGANAAGFIHAQDAYKTVLSGGGHPGEGQGLHNYSVYLVGGASLTVSVPACTTVEVLYWETTSSTDFTITVDGGSPTTVTHGAGVGVYKWATVTGLSNAAHSVVLAGSLIVICGVRYHSGYGVAVGRFGRAGFSASDSIGLGDFNIITPLADRANALNAYGATPNALNIVAFSNNDYARQVSYGNSLAEYESSLRAIVAQGAAAGGCTLLLAMTERDIAHPTAATGPIAQSAYWDVMRKIALDTDHVAHTRMVDVMGTWAVARAGGLLADGEHPTRSGYGLISNTVFRLLTHIPGEAGL